jgi:phage terminase large subunit
MNFAQIGKWLDKQSREINRRVSPGYSEYRKKASGYRYDFLGYCHDIIHRYPTEQQREIAEKLRKPPYRVLVRSANNVGKTFAEACEASWFYDTFKPGICRATGPTIRQVRDLLFKELRRIRRYKNDFAPVANSLRDEIDHYVEGFTAKNADSFQGTHEEYLMLLFDEATGIPVEFWDRGEGMFGGHEGHYWLACYNPNNVSSPAYLAEESQKWEVVQLSALNHVNIIEELKGKPPVIPSAIRLSRIIDRIQSECDEVSEQEYDETTDFEFPKNLGKYYRPKISLFESQVLGRWPLLGTDSLFSPTLVDKCLNTQFIINPEYELQIGLDVARFGDDNSAIAVRLGPCLLHTELHSKRDTPFLTERLLKLLWEYEPDEKHRRKTPIVIDSTGGYGGGIADNMFGYNVLELSFQMSSPDPRYVRLRSFLWFSLAEMALANALDFSRISNSHKIELKKDLIAPRYRVDEQGRKVVEAKVQIKQRLKRSPDLAEAVCLAYYTE